MDTDPMMRKRDAREERKVDEQTIRIGATPHAVSEIQAMLAGYAYGAEAAAFAAEGRSPIGNEPAIESVPKWAYQSYDCVPAATGPITPLDVFVVDGINGQLDAQGALVHHPASLCAAMRQTPGYTSTSAVSSTPRGAATKVPARKTVPGAAKPSGAIIIAGPLSAPTMLLAESRKITCTWIHDHETGVVTVASVSNAVAAVEHIGTLGDGDGPDGGCGSSARRCRYPR